MRSFLWRILGTFSLERVAGDMWLRESTEMKVIAFIADRVLRSESVALSTISTKFVFCISIDVGRLVEKTK